ncbi:delta-lactam-biosynthetic de-N-acetylase [Clostridium sp. DJ247]|uniref:delta-lactam-biosynthetic de-N-acetylase n=1 Tax=Clostridium sp. DJ247 TaxID=2726188 RepID=UPI001623993A|nr:delta-lactam-biosynthetic de-N-acetylase [Clostridium sp. DJ247]MBC2581175.1 delta-lactam-biosynthetic de-N-acetylase [Clostridium sp. DJ247]
MSKKIVVLCTLCVFLLCSCSNKNIDNLSNTPSTSTTSDTTLITSDNNISSTTTNNSINSNSINNNDNIKNDMNYDNKNSNTKELNISNLNSTEKNWFFQPKKDGSPSGEPQEILDLINKYSAYYLGDTSKKVLYLTFDEGYENGYTSKILDILKENNVKAAFFVTLPFINTNKDLIKRMDAEGHLVCNHSNTHPSMAKAAKKGKDSFENEFSTTEKAYEDVTGKKMPKFFRPPMGKYSELSLYYTKELGYKTIFWSFAYGDWDTTKQPSPDYGKKIIAERTHNGAIVLLHAVSKTNTEILDYVIKDWKSKGYEIEPLDKLP